MLSHGHSLGQGPLTLSRGRAVISPAQPLSASSSSYSHIPVSFLWTDHFPFGTEEGMALQVLIELVLGNVGKHFIVDLVCRAVGYPERQNEMSCPGHCVQGRSTNPSSDLPASSYPRASSSGAKQGRQRERGSVTRLECNSFQKQRS